MKFRTPTLRILPLNKQLPPVLPQQCTVPEDAVPGEVLMIPDTQGRTHWFVLADKQRWWAGGKWNITGTLAEFDPSMMNESEIYNYRLSVLQSCGWIS
ncbi:MAG: hypothetical protein SFU85_06480 [Candidatus Methylacidiphilales bacterium]|nr:hypothetical protein [Candidatus Methylacidiphilales bacterium]